MSESILITVALQRCFLFRYPETFLAPVRRHFLDWAVSIQRLIELGEALADRQVYRPEHGCDENYGSDHSALAVVAEIVKKIKAQSDDSESE